MAIRIATMFAFLLMTFVTISAQTGKVTLSLKDVSISQFFSAIEKQSHYRFSYSDSDTSDAGRITVTLRNEPLENVLKRELSNRGLTYTVQGNKIIVVSDKHRGGSDGDNGLQKITGSVKDRNGEPIIGASVIVKGTRTGTVTDANGKFTINAEANSILQISYMGYQAIEVRARNGVKALLDEDTEDLNEVVVVGYGTARKSDLTGAVSSINGSKINTSNTPQLSTQLQGQIAGVQITRGSGDPSSTATIRVRGVTTMSTNDPLVIVDGVPGNLNDVASEDVENIQVLKDAASAAIYGSRAAAGVILVTTKRAKNKEFHMSYNFEYGIDTPTATPKSTGAVDWMKGLNEYMYNGGASSLNSVYSEDYIASYEQNHLKDPDNYPDTDWMSLGLKKSTNHQRHSFTMTGGTEKLRTNFSLNYYDADAIYKVKSYNKFNVRMNNDYYINKFLHAIADVNLSYGRSNRPQISDMENFLLHMPPMFNAYWSDGTIAPGKDGDNPIAAVALGGSAVGRSYQLRGKIQLDVTPFKDLVISAVFAPNYYFYKDKNHRIAWKAAQLGGGYINGNNFSSTRETETRNDNHSLTFQLYANYHIQLAQHSISAMAGYEDYTFHWENESAYRDNYLLSNFPYLDLGPADSQFNNGTASHNAYRSFFGRIIYSYAQRYMLQANIRSDGSSRFAKGHRWGTFPSISAGWVISEEPWFRNIKNKGLDYWKIRASVGQLGNERIGSDFPYQAALNFHAIYLPNNTTGVSDAVQTAYQPTYAFRDITWESTTTYDIGMDFGVLNNRLRFNFDWYYKKTKDMLLEIGFPSYFGYNAPTNNAADMHTSGWDLELSWNDHIGNFNYGASFNISDYRSKMGYMADRQVIGSNKITEEGSYYNEWYMLRSKGIILNEAAMFDSDGKKIPVYTKNDKPGCIQYEDVNNDGVISASDRIRLGNSLPEFLYGGNLWAEWKNLDFNITFQGIGHQKVLWSWASRPYEYNAYSCPKVLWDSHWSPTASDEENAKAKYPALTSNATNIYAGSDFYLFNGAYMRIKNITVGYTIPKAITRKFFANKLRVYFSANDLPAFSHYPDGYDPEWNKSGELLLTSYIFGLNLTF